MSNHYPIHPRFPTRQQLRAWLAAQDAAAIVGRPRTGDRCPLATYVRAHGFPSGQIDSDAFLPDGNPFQFRALPAWASVFVHDTDMGAAGFRPPMTAAAPHPILDAHPPPPK